MNFLNKPVKITPHLVGGSLSVRNIGTVPNNPSSAAAFMGPFDLGPPKPKTIPSLLDRVFLRWSGHFSAGEVLPRCIEADVIHRARSYALVRVNLALIFATAILSAGMVMSGKAARNRGETLQKQNLDWHKHINDTHRLSECPANY